MDNEEPTFRINNLGVTEVLETSKKDQIKTIIIIQKMVKMMVKIIINNDQDLQLIADQIIYLHDKINEFIPHKKDQCNTKELMILRSLIIAYLTKEDEIIIDF